MLQGGVNKSASLVVPKCFNLYNLQKNEDIIHCKSECVKLYKSAYIYLIHYICLGLFIFIMLHSVYVFILLK